MGWPMKRRSDEPDTDRIRESELTLAAALADLREVVERIQATQEKTRKLREST